MRKDALPWNALRCAARGSPPRRAKTGLVGEPGPSAERKESFLIFSRHLFLSAQARLGNVPGYCHSSLAGLDQQICPGYVQIRN